MKKSVVILIALIYVASIAMVGFLGLKAKSYNDVIYVESIEILTDYSVDKNTGKKFIVFESSYASDDSLKLECRVIPDNASDKKVLYSLGSDCTNATIDESGLLTFTADTSKYFSVKVYIHSNQNRTISDEILIYYVPAGMYRSI